MRTPDEQVRIVSGGMRAWKRRRDILAAERDPMVLVAIEAGISKEDIHQATGLGRSTIDRIVEQWSAPTLIRVRPPRWLGDMLVAAGARDARNRNSRDDGGKQ